MTTNTNVKKVYTQDEIVNLIMTNDEAALRGVKAVFLRQTSDERAEKGTKWTNRFGFSKKHVTRGTALAEKYIAGHPMTATEIQEARAIAYAYRNQLWMISAGVVPTQP